jgi:hypothetical protein
MSVENGIRYSGAVDEYGVEAGVSFGDGELPSIPLDRAPSSLELMTNPEKIDRPTLKEELAATADSLSHVELAKLVLEARRLREIQEVTGAN